jgi:sigma-E factor negative regulatory protein RseA
MDTMQKEELISALADGQLRGDLFAQGVALAGSDPAARECWQNYHLIGDVLRSAELAAGTTAPTAFLSRFQLRMLQEQREAASSVPRLDAAAVVPHQLTTRAASNDTSFRWKLVAGFASLTAIGAIGWSVLAGSGAQPSQPQLADAKSGVVLSSGERAVMIRDPQLDEFLAAHRQAGASALQAPAGFLRNATFEGPDR